MTKKNSETFIKGLGDAKLNRRGFLRGAFAAGVGAASLTVPGVSLRNAYAASDDAALPSYYPSDYESIIEGSKKEQGLTIYSNLAAYNWKPVIDGFKKHYPWVTEISTNNLGSNEVFERYYTETAAGSSPCSFMVTAQPTGWRNFVINHDATLKYSSPELTKLPDFAEPLPGVYTYSTDPILMCYNTALLSEDERPKSMGMLADLVTQNPDKFASKLTTYNAPKAAFGMAILFNWLRVKENGWDTLQKILPYTNPELSSGPMVEKITRGEYLAGYFTSSTVVLPQIGSSGGLLGWSYIQDGTPVFFRGMGIPKTSPEVNTAKLMLDYLLSHDGQIKVYEGGLTPYRPGVPVPRSYDTIQSAVGADNIIKVAYAEMTDSDVESIVNKWNKYI